MDPAYSSGNRPDRRRWESPSEASDRGRSTHSRHSTNHTPSPGIVHDRETSPTRWIYREASPTRYDSSHTVPREGSPTRWLTRETSPTRWSTRSTSPNRRVVPADGSHTSITPYTSSSSENTARVYKPPTTFTTITYADDKPTNSTARNHGTNISYTVPTVNDYSGSRAGRSDVTGASSISRSSSPTRPYKPPTTFTTITYPEDRHTGYTTPAAISYPEERVLSAPVISTARSENNPQARPTTSRSRLSSSDSNSRRSSISDGSHFYKPPTTLTTITYPTNPTSEYTSSSTSNDDSRNRGGSSASTRPSTVSSVSRIYRPAAATTTNVSRPRDREDTNTLPTRVVYSDGRNTDRQDGSTVPTVRKSGMTFLQIFCIKCFES